MKNDVYQDIEEALLAQNYLKNEEEFSPDTEAFQLTKEKKLPGESSELLSGNTTMYMDAIKALDASDDLSEEIGKLDSMNDMSTRDFLGETDFLGYTDYLDGKKAPRGAREEGSYEVAGGENDNPLRNVFGLGPKKTSKASKPAPKKSAGRSSSSSSKKSTNKGSHKVASQGAHAAKTAVKGTVKGTEKAVSTGKKAVMGGVHFIQLIVRIFCFILMLSTAYQIARVCYSHINDLGEVAYMIPYRNYAQFLYIFLAVLAVIFAVLSAFRILAARRRIVKGKAVNGDYGQGLIPFILFILLAVSSGILPNYIPYTPELQGVILFLNMIQVKEGLLIKVNTVGALLCLARKLTHSM